MQKDVQQSALTHLKFLDITTVPSSTLQLK